MEQLCILLIIYFTFSPLVAFYQLILICIVLIWYIFYFKINITKKQLVLLFSFNCFFLGHWLIKSLIIPLEKPGIVETIIDNNVIYQSIIGYLVSLILRKNFFWKKFERIIFILGCMSLFFFFLQSYNIELIKKIPKIKIESKESVVIYTFIKSKYSIYLHRNSGLAWEPGAFQLLLNLGFFLENLIQKKINLKKIIYAICIFTTKSSIGLIIFIIQFIYFSYKNFNLKNNKKILIFFLTVSIFLLKDSTLENGYIKKFVIQKLNLKNKDESTLERKEHFDLDIKSFQKNIFLGRGIINYKKDRYNKISSNSHTRILATYGILFYIFYMGMLFGNLKKIIKNNYLLILILILTFTNEVIWATPLFFILIFMERNNENKIM